MFLRCLMCSLHSCKITWFMCLYQVLLTQLDMTIQNRQIHCLCQQSLLRQNLCSQRKLNLLWKFHPPHKHRLIFPLTLAVQDQRIRNVLRPRLALLHLSKWEEYDLDLDWALKFWNRFNEFFKKAYSFLQINNCDSDVKRMFSVFTLKHS